MYDWAFPAADQPCLWESKTHAVPIDDRYLMWLGMDYQMHVAATARLGRTNIELSVLEGSFSGEELRDIDPAWIDERYGPFDAMWQNPATDMDFKLLSSVGVTMSGSLVLGAIERLTG